jgi:hypothetical protein
MFGDKIRYMLFNRRQRNACHKLDSVSLNCQGNFADIRAKDIGSGQSNGSGGLGFLCINRDLYCCEKNISVLTTSSHLSILPNNRNHQNTIIKTTRER